MHNRFNFTGTVPNEILRGAEYLNYIFGWAKKKGIMKKVVLAKNIH